MLKQKLAGCFSKMIFTRFAAANPKQNTPTCIEEFKDHLT